MLSRFITLFLIVVLALPVATLTRPAETHPSPWDEVAVAAKGKKHKKKITQPKSTTITRTIRQPVTETFINSAPIAFTEPPGVEFVRAATYPASIFVSGFNNGVITDVNLILTDFTHGFVSDVEVLLSHGGRRAVVLSDVGSGLVATDFDLTLDDEAAAELPQGATWSSGTFRPADFFPGVDTFAAPAPAPDGNVALSTFDGADPNGIWQLWVMDSHYGDPGDIGGWALEITAEVDAGEVQDQVPVTKAKPHKKKGKRRR
jgi:hypothetical protein